MIGSGSSSTSEVGDFNGDGVEDLAVITASGAIFTVQIRTQNTEITTDYAFLSLDAFSLDTQSEALDAKDVFEAAQDTIQEMQGKVGASLSRLEAAVNVNSATAGEYEAARSRIVDADIAQDVAELTRLSILQQASTAILAQANLQPSIAASLIRDSGVP